MVAIGGLLHGNISGLVGASESPDEEGVKNPPVNSVNVEKILFCFAGEKSNVGLA